MGHLPAVTERGGAHAPPGHHLQWGPHNVMASYDYVHFTDEETEAQGDRGGQTL